MNKRINSTIEKTGLHNRLPLSRGQRGMVLIVVLIMLTVLTILGITTMSNSTMEERMAANVQEYNRAFQAAESGISEHMKESDALLSTATQASPVTHNYSYRSGKETVNTASWYEAKGREAPPGYSMGGPFRAHYFSMQSDGSTTSGASSQHRQGYYVIGPG